MKILPSILMAVLAAGCTGTRHSDRFAVLSTGDLMGRVVPMPNECPGTPVQGAHEGDPAVLSEAVRNALDGTEYDTLLDATVTTHVNRFWFLWLSVARARIEVTGKGVKSSDFKEEGK